MQQARWWALPSWKVWLIDQGMTNMLRKHAHESAGSILHDLPLPDIVVNVTAPQAVRMARIVTRDKPDHVPSQYLTGEHALEVGRMHARQWFALFGPEGAMQCLRAYSRWQCRPYLYEQDLRSLLTHAQETPLTEEDEAALSCEPLPQSLCWLHDGYVERGVKWIYVVNGGRESPQEHASRIVEAIRQWHA